MKQASRGEWRNEISMEVRKILIETAELRKLLQNPHSSEATVFLSTAPARFLLTASNVKYVSE